MTRTDVLLKKEKFQQKVANFYSIWKHCITFKLFVMDIITFSCKFNCSLNFIQVHIVIAVHKCNIPCIKQIYNLLIYVFIDLFIHSFN